MKFDLPDHVLAETTHVDHDLLRTERKSYRCSVCGLTWECAPISKCPDAKVYQWQPWPEGLFTRKQLAEKRLIPGVVAGVIAYDKSADGDGWLRLYRESDATPKPPDTEKQLVAREKAKATRRKSLTCSECGKVMSPWRGMSGGMCEWCWRDQEDKARAERDKAEAREWAARIAGEGFVVLDTETTGLTHNSEIIQIAVVDQTGEVLLDTYIKPLKPIDERPVDDAASRTAFSVNGISNAMVADAPTFAELYPRIVECISGKHLVIYNVEFDRERLWFDCRRAELPYLESLPAEWHCAMLWYAQYYSEWSDYHKSYKWQKLNGGDHTALGDCLATLGLVRAMAEKEIEPDEQPQ